MMVRARMTSPPSRRMVRSQRVDLHRLAGDQDLGAEPAGLAERAAAELVAGDAVREAEVVLDARRGLGLAAGGLALDDERAQALGGAVDRGGEAGRAAADDDRVVVAGAGRGAGRGAAASVARVGRGRASRRRRGAAPGDCAFAAGARPASGRRGRGRRRQPVEADLVAREEPLQVVAGGVPAVAEHVTCGFGGLGGDALQPADALGGEAADPGLELGRGRGQRVVLARLHAQDARWSRSRAPSPASGCRRPSAPRRRCARERARR